jgi:DNA-binding FrmR family transcriptional regulator
MSENHEAEVHMDNGGHAHDHTHDHGDAHGHSHEHGHSHDHDEAHDHSHTRNHSHTHDPQQTRAIINRLKRSIGHLDKVRRMVEDGEDCADVLIQLSAVKSEINNTGKLILKQHMEHCIVEAVRENDQTSIDKMNEAIDRFMK